MRGYYRIYRNHAGKGGKGNNDLIFKYPRDWPNHPQAVAWADDPKNKDFWEQYATRTDYSWTTANQKPIGGGAKQ